MIGIDAHKRTHTLVAIDSAGRKLDQLTIGATPQGHLGALQWALKTFGPAVRWAVEDCRAVTIGLERDLMNAGYEVIRVPTWLSARTRVAGREQGKSDPIDAIAVARAALANPDLPVARHHARSRDIQLLADRRDSLVARRTAQTNRLLWRIHELDPTHLIAPRSLAWMRRQDELGDWLEGKDGLVAEVARAELDDIRTATLQINEIGVRLKPMVRTAAPSLLQIHGCATLTAARVIAETADVTRFRNEAAYARFAGVTPVPHWSGSSRGRLRSHQGGNRALNVALHQIAMTRIKPGAPYEASYRLLRESMSHLSAMRRLKRRLVRTVYNGLRADYRNSPMNEMIERMDAQLGSWQQQLALREHDRGGGQRQWVRGVAVAPLQDNSLLMALAAQADQWQQELQG